MRAAGVVLTLVTLSGSLTSSPSAQTAGTGEPRLTLSAYLQPQLELGWTHDESRDRAFLRRMVIGLDVELSPDWQADIQADLGPLTDDSDRITVKNALIAYTGWDDRGIVLSVGNQKIPFSRSVLGSSSRRGLIERPFTGDREYGSPGRAMSVRVDGWHRDQTVFWSAAIADTRHSTDVGEVRVDGVAELGDTGNEGHLLGGRIELHPRGEMPREQGDFERGPLRFTLGGGAYVWRRNGDTAIDEGEVDASRVSGVEISGGLRGGGLSVDAEFDHVSARARRPVPDAGLYAAGEATLRKGSIESGYMLVRERLELLAGLDALATPTFERTWRRVSLGMNWYVRRHDLKFSFMHRESFHERGVRDARSRAAYLQAQLAF